MAWLSCPVTCCMQTSGRSASAIPSNAGRNHSHAIGRAVSWSYSVAGTSCGWYIIQSFRPRIRAIQLLAQLPVRHLDLTCLTMSCHQQSADHEQVKWGSERQACGVARVSIVSMPRRACGVTGRGSAAGSPPATARCSPSPLSQSRTSPRRGRLEGSPRRPASRWPRPVRGHRPSQGGGRPLRSRCTAVV